MTAHDDQFSVTHQIPAETTLPEALVASSEGDQAIEDTVAATDAPAGKPGGALREILETVLLAALIFFCVRALVLNFRVDGLSMYPNLQNHEMLIVNRNAYSHFDLNKWLDKLPFVERDTPDDFYPMGAPDRGDIVILDPSLADRPVNSDEPYIKRVIGLPGETLQVRDGAVYINGEQLEEPYIAEGITDCGEPTCPEVQIPEGRVFVMGDNRQNSSDSRVFGTIPVEAVIGKAMFTYWPVGEIGLVPHYDYPDVGDAEP